MRIFVTKCMVGSFLTKGEGNSKKVRIYCSNNRLRILKLWLADNPYVGKNQKVRGDGEFTVPEEILHRGEN